MSAARDLVRALHALILVWLAVSLTPVPAATAEAGVATFGASQADVAQADPRLFAQTGYRIDDDAFWAYFRRRGGVRTFGYPVSSSFTLLGFEVQIFQRAILQRQPDGSVAIMNVLDDGLLPYTTINGSRFPAADPEVVKGQPLVGTPDYHAKALQFVKDTAPDVWQGRRANFFQTFAGAVKAEDAFPDGNVNPGLLLGFNLEIWGLPTSRPTPDPSNGGFVYQRFQRGIMHFDASTGATQGLLLADYAKALLTGRNLPPDLAAQAAKNRLYGQLDPGSPSWVKRPNELPATDLRGAFRREATVFVDPGHGGKEIGSSAKLPDGTTLVEKDLNLVVAGKLVALLRGAGYEVVTSRTTDTQVNGGRDLTGDDKLSLDDDLQARVDRANAAKADLIVSVHFNGLADPTKRGTQVFYAEGRPFSDRGKALAELAQAALLEQLAAAGYETVDRRATPDSAVLGRGNRYYLLGAASEIVKRPSAMPGIIGEPLFLTNPDDARAVRQEKVQDAVARAYFRAIQAYFERYPAPAAR